MIGIELGVCGTLLWGGVKGRSYLSVVLYDFRGVVEAHPSSLKYAKLLRYA